METDDARHFPSGVEDSAERNVSMRCSQVWFTEEQEPMPSNAELIHSRHVDDEKYWHDGSDST